MFTTLASESALRAAWHEVLANDREDEVLSPGVARFAEAAEEEISRLSQEMMAGTYRPQPLTRVQIRKESGGTRDLAIPRVRDRVVERSALALLAPLIDPLLGTCSYAYRAGLGVSDAVRAVAALRDEGFTWVAQADIDDCFPSIPLGLLQRRLMPIIPDERVRELVAFLLARGTVGPGGPRPPHGLPQGSSLSPLLANLMLVVLDDRITAAGFPIVRYADDFVILAHTSDEAREALALADEVTHELGMRLGDDKSAAMSFADGFCFLGEDFGPHYPPASDPPAEEPLQRVLYIGFQGAHLRIDAGHVVVRSPKDHELLSVPSGQLARLVCFGAIGVSAGFRTWALNSGIETVHLSRRGGYLGHTLPATARPRLSRLRAQLAAADDDTVAMPFARAVVQAKVRKQVVVLRRLVGRRNGETVAAATEAMERLLAMLPETKTREEVMGIEGASARTYFGVLGACLPQELAFSGRTRRPPRDVVNSALSYGYALLLAEAVSALCAAGLDPAVGLLHADDDDRPSLALDLMEEFRPWVVDQVVTAAAVRGALTPAHGREEPDRPGVMLTRAGRELLVGRYELRMLQHTRGALPGFAGSIRRHLYRQAERLAALVAGSVGSWSGTSWR